MISWVTCIILGTCPSEVAGAPVHVSFYTNGASKDGMELSFPHSGALSVDVIATLMSSGFAASVGSSLWTGEGVQIDDLLTTENGSSLYVVPGDGIFVWPFVKLGHKVKVPGLHSNDKVWLESVSEEPRIFFLHNFLHLEEADKLKERALSATGKHALEKSTTGVQLRENRDMTDPSSFSSSRTSDNAWDLYSPEATPVIERSFNLARLPVDRKNQDGLQIVRYQLRQAYNAHHDFFPPNPNSDGFNFSPKHGGANRLLTVFLYISDVEEGGQTVFPALDPLTDKELETVSPEMRELLQSHKTDKNITELTDSLFPKGTWQPGMVRDCYSKFSIRPRKGAAVLFYSMKPDLTMDEKSLHGGCPVLKGEKWGSNMWLWNRMRFGHNPSTADPIAATFHNNYPTDTLTISQGGESIGTVAPNTQQRFESFHGSTFDVMFPDQRVEQRSLHANMGVDQHFTFGNQRQNQNRRRGHSQRSEL